MKHINMKDVRMGGTRLISTLVNKCNKNKIIKQNRGTCVQDYIYETCKGEPGFKRYNKETLRVEINKFVKDNKGERPSTREIINWRDNCHTNVSIYALDPFYNTFVSSPAPRKEKVVRLCFICKDNHCYPILNEDLITKISKGSSLIKHLDLIQWNSKHSEDKIIRCENMDEYFNIIKPKPKLSNDLFVNKNIENKDIENHLIVIPEGEKGKDVMLNTMQKTNTYIEYFHYDGKNQIDGFITHDLKNMVTVNNDYDTRKRICDQLYEKYPVENFKFCNQGLTSIAVHLFEQLYGHIPKSDYNRYVTSIIDDYYPRALQHTFYNEGVYEVVDKGEDEGEEALDNITAFDIAKDFPAVLLHNTHNIPVYNIHNTIDEFDGKIKTGEYYIDETHIYKYNTTNEDPIIIEAGFYGRNLIDYLLEHRYIKMEDIKYQLVSDKSIKYNAFVGYISYVFNNFEEPIAKKIANQFIGYLGTKYDKSSKGFTSTCYETACAVWSESVESGEKVSIHKEDNFYLIRKLDVQRKMTENCSINRHVISGSIVKLLELIEDTCGDGTEIYGYNTDAVYCYNPKKEYPVKDKNVKFNSSMIGNVFQKIDESSTCIDRSYRNNITLSDYKLEPGKGILYTGGAGCGKTTQLINDLQESKKPIVFSFTNKAVDNIRDRLPDNMKNIVHTFDSYFNEFVSDVENMKLLTDKDVFIDEYSMVPNKWLTMIYHSFARNDLNVNLYGDSNQCDPVEGNSRLLYDYTKSPAILDMCGKSVNTEYIKESARYDEKTYNMLSHFLKTGQIKEKLGNYVDSYVNICYLNETRIEVNRICADAFCSGKKYNDVKFIYNGKTETYKVCTGTPIICTDNMKNRNMFNAQQFTVKKIDDKFVTIKENDQKFEIDEFRKKFNPAFCVTVYKYQGGEINTHFNILDSQRMNKKQLYTALSRTTKFEYIHIENLKRVYSHKINNKHEELSIGHTEYQKGKIYKIELDDGHIYIGSTIKELDKRLNEHTNDPKSIVFKHKDKNPKISLVTECPCKNKHKLEIIETKYINKFVKDHGSKVLNKRGVEKEKPEIKYSFKIDKEDELMKRINKMVQIKNDKKNKELMIRYKNFNGKKIKVTKNYRSISLDKAMDYMKEKQSNLKHTLTLKLY